MQSVSAAWKAAQQQNIVPTSFVEITYRVTDPDVEAGMTASDNGHLAIGDTSQVLDDLAAYNPYVTLEENSWVLDGSMDFNDGGAATGFVSSVLSGSDCSFASAPVLTLDFASEVTSSLPGLAIQFSEAFQQFATDFTVATYNGGTLVDSLVVSDNADVLSELTWPITGFDKITITLTKWSQPYCRARIEQITLGSVEVFTGTDILGFEHSEAVDLLSLALPHAEVVFSISNVNGDWNPDNPSGNFRYLIERQKVVVKYGYRIGTNIEWIKCGTFFLSEWNTPQNGITATFTARDALEFAFNDFVATPGQTYTLYQLADMAFTQSAAEVTWSIDNSLSAISVTVPNDFTYTCAEVIQLCANAACCVMYQNRDGVFVIEPLATALTDYAINEFVSYANAEYDVQKQLMSVNVNDGMGTYTASSAGEVQTIENPLIQTATVANAVAAWVAGVLNNRRLLSGEYRADPRLDALDKVTVTNKYATQTAFITSIHYDYNGMFTGKYEGRVMA